MNRAEDRMYSRCLRWSRVCHDVIRGDAADEEEKVGAAL